MAADYFCICKSDICNSQTVDYFCQSRLFCLIQAGDQVLKGFLPESIHLYDLISVFRNLKNISEIMDKSSGNKFFQCRFRQSIYIHGISACKKGKGFNLLGCAIRVCAIKCFYIIHLLNLCGMSTGRTGFRYLQFTAAGKILCNLWNDHIRLVHRDYISDTEFQFFYNADIMHTGTADSCPLQFNRFKNRHRIDQTSS